MIQVVAHLNGGEDKDTLLMLYQTIVRSKLDCDVLYMALLPIPVYNKDFPLDIFLFIAHLFRLVAINHVAHAFH